MLARLRLWRIGFSGFLPGSLKDNILTILSILSKIFS